MTESRLFIGGVADGTRMMIEINHSDLVRVPQFNSDGTTTEIYYRRETLTCEDRVFHLMIEQGMLIQDALQMLIYGYSSNKSSTFGA